MGLTRLLSSVFHQKSLKIRFSSTLEKQKPTSRPHTALLHTTTTCEDLMTGTWQPEQFSRLAASRNPRAQTSLSEPREIRFEFPPHRSEGSGVEAKLGSKNCPGARSVIADFVTKHRCCDYSRL
jgi:hypothetical protein